ncbi:MAG: response regulator [Gemmatimonadaceae bacterium]
MIERGLSQRLLATFLDELDEQVRALNADLLVLESQPDDADRLKSVFRIAHTLKGAARAAAVPAVEELSHTLETMLAGAREGARALEKDHLDTLFAAADALSDAGQRIRGGQSLDDSPLALMSRTLRDGRPLPADERSRTRLPKQAPEPTFNAETSEHPPTSRTPTSAEVVEENIRVGTAKLDTMLATAGQLLMGVGRVESVAGEMDELQEAASRWAGTWHRSSGKIRVALERTGMPTDMTAALAVLDKQAQQFARDTARLAQQVSRDSQSLSRVADDVMERTRGLRMRPFTEATEALPRLVRDVASETRKEVDLQISGGELEADRIILDGLREAIVHLVRNAIDHGIESPAERESKGKNRRGNVEVSAALRGDSMLVTVKDDGTGLNLQAIRAKLVSRGRAVPEDDRALARVLFEGGFSTRKQATSISGRGVGLDIVESAVERIRGSVDVTWIPGTGSTFTMSVPLTLSTVRAMLVAAGSQIVAIPTSAVERMMRLELDEISDIDGQRALMTPDGPVPVASLARLLGPPMAERAVGERLFAVLVAAGRRRVVVVVDELLEEAELVVRPIGRPVPRLSGAALLPSGRVALVVNVSAITATGIVRDASAGGAVVAASAMAKVERKRILVADDSITTRTLEQSVLEAAGYDVVTAVDGADAWRMLQERGADLLVTDIEMPRMDGFALTQKIRASERHKELPVILVTSLESEEHRSQGMDAGADAYIVKTSFDQAALLSTIKQLIR